jgi:hypothetical protein
MEINIQQQLARFKVYERVTLFETDYSLLREFRCPICQNKLRVLKSGVRAICTSKKHPKAFTIGMEQLNKLTNKKPNDRINLL